MGLENTQNSYVFYSPTYFNLKCHRASESTFVKLCLLIFKGVVRLGDNRNICSTLNMQFFLEKFLSIPLIKILLTLQGQSSAVDLRADIHMHYTFICQGFLNSSLVLVWKTRYGYYRGCVSFL